MRNCFRIGVLLLPGVLILLDGCSQAEPEHHTVSWYADHDQERGVKLTWCADDAARKATDDCRNAAAAMAGAQSNGRQFHPPMDDGTPNPKPAAPAKP